MAEFGKDVSNYEAARAQAKHHLSRGRKVDLEKEADHARAMSRDRQVPAKQRTLWAQLADELDTRLGRNAPPSEQISLF